MKKAMIDYMKKEKNDDLYTPYSGIYPLVKHLTKKKVIIWEPCDYGKSKITEVLGREGYETVSTDIIHGFNFLTDEPDFHFDWIITNPPYSLKDAFIEKCYSYGKPSWRALCDNRGLNRHNWDDENGVEVEVKLSMDLGGFVINSPSSHRSVFGNRTTPSANIAKMQAARL